jgi:AraC-like DNA-binding protein
LALTAQLFYLGFFGLRQSNLFVTEKNQLGHASLQSGPDQPVSLDKVGILTTAMTQQKPHLKPRLTIGELSQITGLPEDQISQIVRSEFGQNFFEFVNSYRVQTFIENLEKGPASNSLLNLAYDAGFNSKTAFNEAFRRKTGQTPSQYRMQLQSNPKHPRS